MAATKKKISYFSANVTAVISVALVLLLLGIVAVIGVAANGLTLKIKEQIGFDISMREDATEQQVAQLRREIAAAPFVARTKYVSKDDALRVWREETGEDLMAVLGFNPLTAEIEVHVKAGYSSLDSIDCIAARLRQRHPAIDCVTTHRENIEAINRTLTQTALVLGVAALAMLIISVALINNTVRMTIYSKRFLIHTMKLTGASWGFIRRPFVRRSVVMGVIAALFADAMLWIGAQRLLQWEPELSAVVTAEVMLLVSLAVLLAGIVLTWLCALFSVGRYLRMKACEMYYI